MLEPTKMVKTILVEANELAIVDARVVKDLNPNHPLVKNAILIPTGALKGGFDVSFSYGDLEELNGLTITPAVQAEDAIADPTGKGAHETEIDKKISRHTLKGQTAVRNGKKLEGLQDPAKRATAKVQQKVQLDTPANVKRERQAKRTQATLSCEAKQVADFVNETMASHAINEEKLAALPNKLVAKHVFDKLSWMACGNWKAENNKIVLESDGVAHTADPAQWDVKDGYLISKATGKRPEINFDIVYDARSKLRQIIESEAANEATLIAESIRGLNGGHPGNIVTGR